MKYLAYIIVFIFIAIAAGVLVHKDPGYLFLSYAGTSVETSLAVAIVAGLLAFLVLYFTFRIFGVAARVPSAWRRNTFQRRKNRAARSLTQGFVAFICGQHDKAERLLRKDAEQSEYALLHYLLAAEAAHQQGAGDKRDALLKRALESQTDAELGISLVRLRLLLQDKDHETAGATLQRLRQIAPANTEVLRLAVSFYRDQEDWHSLSNILPVLHKHPVCTPDELDVIETLTWKALLGSASKDSIQIVWEKLPRAARDKELILQDYVLSLSSLGLDRIAENLLRARLNKNWSSLLAREYGLLNTGDPAKQLNNAELWLKNHGRDSMLLLSLGRLCVKRKLWGKARIYFESSLGVEPRAETHLALGELLEQLHESEAAKASYKAGLALAVPSGRNENHKPRLISSNTSDLNSQLSAVPNAANH